MDPEGKRVLISGATGGIGRAIAQELAGRDCRLVLSSRRKEELEQLARSLPGGAQRHEVVVADLAEPGAAERLVEDAGDIDVLVANAALPASGTRARARGGRAAAGRAPRASAAGRASTRPPRPAAPPPPARAGSPP